MAFFTNDSDVETWRYEWNRYSSFHRYPAFQQLPLWCLPCRLAPFGFYYLTQIQCFYCHRVFDPLIRQPPLHFGWCNWQVLNVPFGRNARQIPRVDLFRFMGIRPPGPAIDLRLLVVLPYHRPSPYESLDQRLESFRIYFPEQMDDGVRFALAGFFAYPTGHLCCHFCGLIANPAQLMMPPGQARLSQNYALIAHNQLSPNCTFASSRLQIRLPPPSPQLQTLLERGDCHVCQRLPANVAFRPCGHVVTCERCSNSQDICPVRSCRALITFRIPVYRQ